MTKSSLLNSVASLYVGKIGRMSHPGTLTFIVPHLIFKWGKNHTLLFTRWVPLSWLVAFIMLHARARKILLSHACATHLFFYHTCVRAAGELTHAPRGGWYSTTPAPFWLFSYNTCFLPHSDLEKPLFGSYHTTPHHNSRPLTANPQQNRRPTTKWK